ncbi:DUF695 domain-containing protein [Reinekea blandensis]|uniref:DUF695 domain-containing protein n=1 Tax=Reinekea blandensis MED297 TaxID=314283 RepID=A4BFC1_9GAMM|nr:DUF695 domain-containing protein [Reinekea blandensis]EAR09234.1 hypothetical protein MED297_07123 [Reinekea sp. MED297] [Reinekea blandensis MED297]
MNKVMLFVLILLSSVFASGKSWESMSFEYEGYPLYLRIPIGQDYENLSESYSKHISITHHLEKVLSNGLPENEYNESLIDFDSQVTSVLENTELGVTVLVETFGGRRTYYMYSVSSLSVEHFKNELSNKFPEYSIDVHSYSDEDWSFIKQYSEEWGF